MPRPVILTPDRRLRVFVSSTLDLIKARAAAKRAIESLDLTPVMFEAGARPHPPRALYAAYVEQSDVFVAIYSRRYGWTAPGMDVSGLEDEFNLSARKPRLVYIEAGVDREPELERLIGRVGDADLSYKPFASPSQLEELLRGDLIVLMTERFHASDTQSAGRAKAPPAPVPVPPTVLVGRDREVHELVALVERDDVRLVTLVGAGGIGKTRLAIEGARRLQPAFTGGTFFVPLATVREPQLVAEAIAAGLDVAVSDAYPAIAAIADFVGDRRVLLVLDNFEQLTTGAVIVTDLLASCVELKVLVTSRAALRLRGEHEMDVPPLAVPPQAAGADQHAASPAVQLFVESARAVRPGFDVDDRSAAAVMEICRQLDGLPLAIELVAAMVRVLTPELLLERLQGHPTEVGRGRRDMPERHQTLSATIAWSYELLDEPTKQLFAQLSAFRGGFTLERAEQVCDIDGDVLASVGSLAEHSLLRLEAPSQHGQRFIMLSTIHRFALERLEESEHRDRVLARHARAFVELAEQVGRPGGRQRAVMDAIEADLDNVRRAFEWLLANADPEPVAAGIGESWWFWWMRGHVKEGKLWAVRCLEVPNLGREARARALGARAMFAIWSGEYEVAVRAFQEAAETGRDIGDTRSVAYADIGVGLVRGLTSSIGEGAALIRRAVATFEEQGDDLGATTGLAALSWAQAITRRFDGTDDMLREAFDRSQKSGSDVEIGLTEAALAQFQLERGDTGAAVDLVGDSLEHLASARHIGSTILTLEVIAELGIAADATRDATAILGATAAVRSAMGTRVPPDAAARLERLLDVARGRLGKHFDAAFALGSQMGFPQAVEEGRKLLNEMRLVDPGPED